MHCLRLLLLALSVLTASLEAEETAGFAARFGQSPYEMGSPVIGVAGWETYGIRAEQEFDPGQIGIVSAPWDESRPVLALRKNQAGGLPLRLRNSFPPVQGAIALEAKLAFDFPAKASSTSTSVNFHDTSHSESSISFGMSYGAEGGLFLRYQESPTSKQSVAILPKADVKVESPYLFVLNFRPQAGTLDLKVSGLKKDGEPFEFLAKDLPFAGLPAAGVGAIFLENTGPNPRYASYAEEIVLRSTEK